MRISGKNNRGEFKKELLILRFRDFEICKNVEQKEIPKSLNL
jgi:hypothetical protein